MQLRERTSDGRGGVTDHTLRSELFTEARTVETTDEAGSVDSRLDNNAWSAA